MAPGARRSGNETKVNALLDFAINLDHSLSSDNVPDSMIAELYRQVDRVLTIHDADLTNRSHDMDMQGTKLWNHASKVNKGGSISAELGCLVRVFACMFLDCAQRSSHLTGSNDVRVLKTVLRTAKYCLDQRQLTLAERVIERAAFYEKRLAGGSHPEGEHGSRIHQLSKEYYILRVALAWRQDRLDIAELILSKIGTNSDELSPILAEQLADLLFEIASHQAKGSLHTSVVWWLEKARDILGAQSQEQLSSDAGELRLSVMYGLVKALMQSGGDEDKKRAWNIVADLEVESADRLAVLLLKLDLYDTEPKSSPQEYCDVLRRIVRSVHLTDSNVKTILHHVHKLRLRNSRLAHTLLSTLITERLLGAEETAWLEKALITVFWNCTTSPDLGDALGLLNGIIHTVATSLGKPLSPSATYAAHILLWKRIETTFNRGEYENSEAWCNLSLHVIFGNTGENNIGKLQRKLILAALASSDSTKARETHSRMSDSNQKHPLTKYLLYKLALECKDAELATECLDAICSVSTEDVTLLYACVLEAQRVGDQTQTIIALQRVLDKYDYCAPHGVHLPALLRCTARLLIHQMSSSETQLRDGNNEICKLFEGAAVQAKVARRDSKDSLFSLSELDWFSRNSYNLALQFCMTWTPPQTLRLVQACLKLLDLYPSDIEVSIIEDLSLRRLFCEFLSASLLIVVARGEDIIEHELQYYLGVRKATSRFRIPLHEQLNRLAGGARADILSKYSSILAFDFEGAARLKAWGNFEQIVDECQYCEDPKIYGALADVLLSCEAPNDTKIAILQQIVNIVWRLDSNDIAKLSRWIRCLFSMANTTKIELAEHLLDQVVTIAADAKKKATPYPPEEIAWLSSTAFNRAVDFYSSSQDEACRRWAGKALEIASLSDDGGTLQDLLQEKFMGLTWDH